MNKLILIFCLLTSACYSPPSTTSDQLLEEDNIQSENLTEGPAYYPQPDFDSDRYYKVEDQYGCKWWIDSGHKFDHEWIALNDKKEADCKDRKYAPTRQIDLLNKNGEVRGVSNEKTPFVNSEKP